MSNWVAVIVVIGVCLIPSLYAWFNIAANMDPYSNTQGIKIAVANCDEGTDNEATGKLNAGDEIVENLKANDSLGWIFVAAMPCRAQGRGVAPELQYVAAAITGAAG